MATLSHNDIAQAIYMASKDKKGHELSDIVHSTVKFLAKKRLISKSESILNKLEKFSNKEDGILIAKIVSVKYLGEDSKKDIASILKQKYNAKKVLFEEVEDKTVLGGVKIEVENEIIDLTIFNKLKKLQEHLTR
ncbi:MAG: ATP synthase F1 subunit delta [Patescibacteria group bacterium]